MRILAVSNFYPPNERSGYELGSLDIVESLRTRGHQVKVLTSDQRTGLRVMSAAGSRRARKKGRTGGPSLLKN
jgi:hypothetical protein